jgi:hypothetical protein
MSNDEGMPKPECSNPKITANVPTKHANRRKKIPEPHIAKGLSYLSLISWADLPITLHQCPLVFIRG